MRKLPISKAEYWNTAAISMRNLFKEKEWIEKLTLLAGCVPNDFKTMFGDSSFTYKSGDGIVECWVIEFKEQLFGVISAETRGTILETSSINNLETIKEFINDFINDLKKINKSKFDLNRA
jgi:hypothetical protein